MIAVWPFSTEVASHHLVAIGASGRSARILETALLTPYQTQSLPGELVIAELCRHPVEEIGVPQDCAPN